jgi:hypothetical protein
MVICESYMIEFSVSKGMKNKITMIKGEFQHIPTFQYFASLVKSMLYRKGR